MNRYTVEVTASQPFYCVVEVDAETQEEALELASNTAYNNDKWIKVDAGFDITEADIISVRNAE